MNSSLNAIFGKRALGKLSSDDYVRWAGDMLMQGYDSYSLRILASLDKFVNTYETEQYFLRSIEEIHLEVPDRDAAILNYACEIAQQMIEGTIKAQDGVRLLYKIYIASDYPHELIIWLDLDDALDSLDYGHYPYSYPSATIGNFDEIAKHEAANFIADVCGKAVATSPS